MNLWGLRTAFLLVSTCDVFVSFLKQKDFRKTFFHTHFMHIWDCCFVSANKGKKWMLGKYVHMLMRKLLPIMCDFFFFCLSVTVGSPTERCDTHKEHKAAESSHIPALSSLSVDLSIHQCQMHGFVWCALKQSWKVTMCLKAVSHYNICSHVKRKQRHKAVISDILLLTIHMQKI